MAFDWSNTVLQTATTTSSLLQLLGAPVLELGISGGVGYAVGYALKKILKIIIAILGVVMAFELGFLYWLQSLGAITITVNQNALNGIGTSAVTWGTTELGGLIAFASTITLLGTGFTGGAALGFSKA